MHFVNVFVGHIEIPSDSLNLRELPSISIRARMWLNVTISSNSHNFNLNIEHETFECINSPFFHSLRLFNHGRQQNISPNMIGIVIDSTNSNRLLSIWIDYFIDSNKLTISIWQYIFIVMHFKLKSNAYFNLIDRVDSFDFRSKIMWLDFIHLRIKMN